MNKKKTNFKKNTQTNILKRNAGHGDGGGKAATIWFLESIYQQQQFNSKRINPSTHMCINYILIFVSINYPSKFCILDMINYFDESLALISNITTFC